MKFQIYNPSLRFIPEKERHMFTAWQKVGGLEDMLKAIYPTGPYIVCDDGPTEKTACTVEGHEFFVDPAQAGFGYLTEYFPCGWWSVRGFVRLDDGDEFPDQTAVWNKDKETWGLRKSIPPSRE